MKLKFPFSDTWFGFICGAFMVLIISAIIASPTAGIDAETDEDAWYEPLTPATRISMGAWTMIVRDKETKHEYIVIIGKDKPATIIPRIK